MTRSSTLKPILLWALASFGMVLLLGSFILVMRKAHANDPSLLVKAKQLAFLPAGQVYYWASPNELVMCQDTFQAGRETFLPVRVFHLDSKTFAPPVPEHPSASNLTLEAVPLSRFRPKFTYQRTSTGTRVTGTSPPQPFFGCILINNKVFRRIKVNTPPFYFAFPYTGRFQPTSLIANLQFVVLYQLRTILSEELATGSFNNYDEATRNLLSLATQANAWRPFAAVPSRNPQSFLRRMGGLSRIFATCIDYSSNQYFYLTTEDHPSSAFLEWLHHLLPKWFKSPPINHSIGVWMGVPSQSSLLYLGQLPATSSQAPVTAPSTLPMRVVTSPPFNNPPKMFWKVPQRNAVSFVYQGHIYLLSLRNSMGTKKKVMHYRLQK
ncbi:MAG TPA: hypothetical protein VKV18_11475 [Chthonomonas sp.]|uniref:hypothetical protein n=1 Tax=Chthonomonas sp. TaxID=2282153 RepID=UPI002B4B4C55|nr:hypothetical protein [Chthonomonas sp.]HLI49292.1 hypothetical protein [Chthonomonas sp.]